MELQIGEEIANGRYRVLKEPAVITSALGAIPKPDSNKICLIHDCSRPVGKAVNDFAINPESQQLITVQDAVEHIKKGYYMAKLDISNAYWSVRVHPEDHQLLGLSWEIDGEGKTTYLCDARLPFGARLAPAIFHRLSQAVIRNIEAQVGHLVTYINDFYLSHPTWEGCQQLLNKLCRTLRNLGFTINYSKVVGPTRRITFLGVEINSDTRWGLQRISVQL